ncbi:MAG: hypothetical protein AB1714_13920 [Acidobacteriota bacterium]
MERSELIVRPPRGNRVRSYIDTVAPDGIRDGEVLRRLKTFLDHSQRREMPWDGIEGPCRFRIWIDPEFAREWLREAAILWDVARSLWRPSA